MADVVTKMKKLLAMLCLLGCTKAPDTGDGATHTDAVNDSPFTTDLASAPDAGDSADAVSEAGSAMTEWPADCALPAIMAEVRRADGSTYQGCFAMDAYVGNDSSQRGPVLSFAQCEPLSITVGATANGFRVGAQLLPPLVPRRHTSENTVFRSWPNIEGESYGNTTCVWRYNRPAALGQELDVELVSPCMLQDALHSPRWPSVTMVRMRARGVLLRGFEPATQDDAGSTTQARDCAVR
ncbi:MAG: hypothetical protein JNK72_02700 [Myxococcales bacterium]|nr:hypothetical protein [Myxococcales bacterium]